jgi:hypothetical protein
LVICPPLGLGLAWAFLQQPLRVLTRQTRRAVHTIDQSIF